MTPELACQYINILNEITLNRRTQATHDTARAIADRPSEWRYISYY